MCDPRLGVLFFVIEDSYASDLTGSSGCGWNTNQWFERPRYWFALSNWGIHIVKYIRWICALQIGNLGCVNGGPASECSEAIKFSLAGKFCRGLKRFQGWLSTDLTEELPLQGT